MFQKEKDYLKAIEHYSNAIKLNPQKDKAYCNRGAAYLVKGEIDQAMEDFNEAIKLNSEFALSFNNRGAAYRDLKAHMTKP